MEQTSEELPNFSIGIDFLGPDPTSSKKKAEKNLQVARFANLIKNLFILSVRISSYGCTRVVWRALKKLELHSAIYPSASITRYTHS